MGQVKLVRIYAWFIQSLNMSSIHPCPVMLSLALYHFDSLTLADGVTGQRSVFIDFENHYFDSIRFHCSSKVDDFQMIPSMHDRVIINRCFAF